MRKYWSEIGWDLGFELGLPVVMVLVTPFWSPLGYPINLLLGLAIDNSFIPWGGYLVGVSLGTMNDLVVFTGEGFLVGLSLVLPLGSPLDSTNTGLTDIILGVSLGNPPGYLLGSICNINCCGPWLGSCRLL